MGPDQDGDGRVVFLLSWEPGSLYVAVRRPPVADHVAVHACGGRGEHARAVVVSLWEPGPDCGHPRDLVNGVCQRWPRPLPRSLLLNVRSRPALKEDWRSLNSFSCSAWDRTFFLSLSFFFFAFFLGFPC